MLSKKCLLSAEAAAAETEAAEGEVANAMENCVGLKETGPSEEDKMEHE